MGDLLDFAGTDFCARLNLFSRRLESFWQFFKEITLKHSCRIQFGVAAGVTFDMKISPSHV